MSGDNVGLGPSESSYSNGSTGSDATDNPNNPVDVCRPAPAPLVTPLQSPGNLSQNEPLTGLVVSADFTGQLVNCEFCTFDVFVNGGLVAGIISGVSTSVLSQTIPGTLSELATVSVNLKGTGVNTLGEREAFDTEGSWSFTTLEVASGDTLLHINFENEPLGEWTLEQMKAAGNYNVIGYEGMEGMWAVADPDAQTIVDDPLGIHGKVCRANIFAGHEYNSPQLSVRFDIGNGAPRAPSHDEIYASVDILFPSGFTQGRLVKIPFSLISGTFMDSTHNYEEVASPEGLYGMLNQPTTVSSDAWGTPDGSGIVYTYDAVATMWTEFWLNPDNPSWPPINNGPGLWTMPRDVWTRHEQHLKMNSAFQISSLIDNADGTSLLTTTTDHNFTGVDTKCSVWSGGGQGTNINNGLGYAKWIGFDIWNQDPTLDHERQIISIPASNQLLIDNRGAFYFNDYKDTWVGRYDGVSEYYIVDPSKWAGSKLCFGNYKRLFRWKTGTMGPDGWWWGNNTYGGDPVDPRNWPAEDQNYYYDNIIASTDRITG